ncbi:DUF6151 family protein [Sedimentitalea todarodis]|uniref:DUF6151 family protein n=1 Tax=Sedimentitalea todarodis TaxID=1631240 RepID=A0ABU3VGL3_9RHOB|nr:DUF6151 family protein [Sedimentitalea todarodis]MDU9004814.1 DUF6151 family protein [Sedimentitalea todarodis]
MADTASTTFSCSCGKMRGRVAPAGPKTGTHLICHCRDCRAAARHLGHPDTAQNGVDLFQTSPDTIKFESGTEHLAILRLSPKGPLRWYASCCRTPMFNTLSRPGLAFVTVLVANTDVPAVFGPVVAQGFVPQAGGPAKHKNGARMVMSILSRLIAQRVSGRWKKTPFFDLASGEPTAPVHLIGKEERAALFD